MKVSMKVQYITVSNKRINKKKQYITNKNNIKYKIYKVQSNVTLQQALLLVQLKILTSQRQRKNHANRGFILMIFLYLRISITTVVITAARNTKPPKTPKAITAPRFNFA